jgi:hypothetical protein
VESSEKFVAIKREALRIEESTTFSSKSHFEASRLWGFANLIMGGTATVFAVLAANMTRSYPSIATSLTVSTAILTGLMTFMRVGDRAANHKKAGDQLHGLMYEVGLFIRVTLVGVSDITGLEKQLKAFSDRLISINRLSPSPPRWAYERAKKGIAAGESDFSVDQPRD